VSRIVKAPDERRQELLAIGLDLFMQKGTEGVSIKEVVTQANVATGLFYYYFTSKDAFLEEAINSHITGSIGEMLECLQNKDFPLLQRVKKVLLAFMEHANRYAQFLQQDVINSPQHYVLMDSMLQRLCPIIQDAIEEGISQGIFTVNNAEVAATFIIHGLSGILHTKIPDEAKDRYTKDIESLVLTVLGVSKDNFSKKECMDNGSH